MPALLPNRTTTDNYSDCELGGDRGYAYGTLTIANNPVSVLLKHGIRGAYSETEYEFVTPSTLPLVGIIGRDEIVGCQIKSAIPGGGSPAQVSGWLVEPNVAGLQPGSAYTSLVSASGAITPAGAGAVESARLSLNAVQATVSGVTSQLVLANGYDFNTNSGVWGVRAGVGTGMGVNVTGLYQLLGWAQIAPAAVGNRFLNFRRNAVTTLRGANRSVNVGAGSNKEWEAFTAVELVAGDSIELQAFQDSGGPLNVNDAWLQMILLHT